MVDLANAFDRARRRSGEKSAEEDSPSFHVEPPPWNNIIEMFEMCPAVTLTPQQKFIYKCIYGLELDDTEKTIPIWDNFLKNIYDWVTEAGFQQYLIDNDMINQREVNEHVGKNFGQVVMPMGRRGSKSFLVGGIYAYEAGEVLRHFDPHRYYNIIPGEVIGMRTVAPTKSQASIIFKNARTVITNLDWFKPFISKDRGNFFSFWTGYELSKIKSGEQQNTTKDGSVQIEFIACVNRNVRGFGNRTLAADEIAHYILETKSTTSDKKVLDALEPSLATYKTPQGQLDSKLFLLSNPLGEEGVFYSRYLSSFDDRDHFLMIQLPTWLANPTRITSQTLEQAFKEDPDVFWAEYGAKFSANVHQFAKHEWLKKCFTEDEKVFSRRDGGSRGVFYYLGVDLGSVDDHTTFTVVHRDADGNVILDYHDNWDPMSDEHQGEIDPEKIKAHIRWICSQFYVRRAILDQYNGWVMKNDLHEMGLRQFEDLFITPKLKREMFSLTRDYLRNTKVLGYWDPILCSELQRLRLLLKSNYEFSIYKPKGSKDDSVDSFVRAVWSAVQEEHTKGRELRTDQQRARHGKILKMREVRRQGRMMMRGNRWGKR